MCVIGKIMKISYSYAEILLNDGRKAPGNEKDIKICAEEEKCGIP